MAWRGLDTFKVLSRKSGWGDIPVLLTTEPHSFLSAMLLSQMLLGLTVAGLEKMKMQVWESLCSSAV